ncbi:MAG: mechanosensitive ion channel family protein [Candidatus Competibacteraceae bacterium]|nr:mechanosensitive ion channel family protein [Candidatus Competibacteraceae bacterium]
MDRLVALGEMWKGNSENLFIGFLVLVLFSILAFSVERLLRWLLRNSKRPLFMRFVGNAFSIILFLIGFLIATYILFGRDLSKEIMTGIGLLSIVLGFSFKEIGENFIAGIILALKMPFRMGDYIEVGGMVGQVKDLSMRTTQMKTPDGKDIYVPNSALVKNNLISYTIDNSLRYGFVVGLEVGVDFNHAREVIQEAVFKVEGVMKKDKLPNVYINELKSSTTDVQIDFWIFTQEFTQIAEHKRIRSEVMHNVVTDLINNGFYLPCDILEVKNYNTEVLKTKQMTP